MEWLTLADKGRYWAPPGSIGSTKNTWGMFENLEKGTVELLAQKSDFHEYYLNSKKYNGIFVVRKLKNVFGGRAGKEPFVWLSWKTKSQLPHVLGRRAIKFEWMPPTGFSALPDMWRKKIPTELRWWTATNSKKSKKSRHDMRVKAVEFLKAKKELEVELKASDFTLHYRWWKGQTVIRGLRIEFWDLSLDDGSKQIQVWTLDGNPLFEPGRTFNTAVTRIDDKNWMDKTGEIPPGKFGNPNKRIPANLEILDKGKVTILSQTANFISVKFRGKKLKGFWTFRSKPGEDLWDFKKGTLPGKSEESLIKKLMDTSIQLIGEPEEIPKLSNKRSRLRKSNSENPTENCENCLFFEGPTGCKIVEGPVVASALCDWIQSRGVVKKPQYKVSDEDWEAFGRGMIEEQPYQHIVKDVALTPAGPLLLIEDTAKPNHSFSLSKEFHIGHTTFEHHWTQEAVDKIIKIGKESKLNDGSGTGANFSEALISTAESLEPFTLKSRIAKYTEGELSYHLLNIVSLKPKSGKYVLGKNQKISLPFEITGIALDEGRHHEIWYPGPIIAASAPLLLFQRLQLEHGETAKDVVGWVTKTWPADNKRVEFDALVYDLNVAEDILSGKKNSVSVGIWVKEKKTANGREVTKIQRYDELTITDSPECETCTMQPKK